MSARNLIEVDPRCGIGSSCRLIGSSDRNFPSESSQFSLTRPTMLIAKTCRGSNFLSNVVRLSPALSGEAGTLAVPQTLPPLLAPIALVVASGPFDCPEPAYTLAQSLAPLRSILL